MNEVEDSLTVEWRPVPPYHFRRMKTLCEEELLNKLGSGREIVSWIPLSNLVLFKSALAFVKI